MSDVTISLPAGWARREARLPPPPRRALAIGQTGAVLVVLLGLWAVWFPHSPDLAAQVYREHLFEVSGFSIWDNNWYAGHYLLDYSLFVPPLAALVGLRSVGVVAAMISTGCFIKLAGPRFGPRAPLASILFACGAAGDLFIGRITYAVGVTFAMASVLAATRGRLRLAALLSLGCAAASPIAALFLALAAVTDLLVNRVWRRAVALAAPALALAILLALAFPAGGYESFSLTSLVPAALSCAVVIAVLPRSDRLLRVGAGLYLAALILAYVVRSPMGSNAVRLGVLLGPAILVGAGRRQAGAGRRALWGLAVAVAVCWQIAGPAQQSVQASEDPSTQPSYYLPVIGYLDQQNEAGPMRIEVAFTREHWDAVALGRRFALARGWERQLDTQYDQLFYAPKLTAAAYHAWLLNDAVRFVVVSDAALDPSSQQEAALIRRGLPYLRRVFHSSHWEVFAVVGGRPLLSGPGRLVTLADAGFTLDARRAGRFVARIHYTPYWHVTRGKATVGVSPGGWTAITTSGAGRVTIDAKL